MMKLGYSNIQKHGKPRGYYMDDLRKGDAIMSGIMHRDGEKSLHYFVQYEGAKIVVYVRKGEYLATYEFSYDEYPTHIELLNAVYEIEAEMALIF